MKTIHFLGLCIAATFLYSCGGSTGSNQKDASQLAQDSTALLSYLNEPIKAGEYVLDVFPAEIAEFNNGTCRVRVTLPVDRQASAPSVGKNTCTKAVKWLSEQGYDLGLSGIYVTCYVYSPHQGTTRNDMKMQWGHARYDTNTDQVEWKPAK